MMSQAMNLPTPTQRAIERLPAHLRRYVVDQDHGAYTPRDHAVWRHILHRLADRLNYFSATIDLRQGPARTAG